MRAYLTYLFLVLFAVASTAVAKAADEDAYEYDDDEDSWSTSNAGPPTRMLHVKMPNSKPQKDEVWIHQSILPSLEILKPDFDLVGYWVKWRLHFQVFCPDLQLFTMYTQYGL